MLILNLMKIETITKQNAFALGNRQQKFLPFLLGRLFVLMSVFSLFPGSFLFGQELPWEFAPYRMRVWMSIDPNIPISDAERTLLLKQVQQQMEIVYQSVADVDAVITPRGLFSPVLRGLRDISIDRVLANELVLVASKTTLEAKDLRTLEYVLEKGDKVYVSVSGRAEVTRELERLKDDPQWQTLISKLDSSIEMNDEIVKKIRSGEVPCALIRRSELESLGRNARIIPARFPWQLESLLRSYDKIFAVSVQKNREQFDLEIIEIDCNMRIVGPLVKATSPQLDFIARSVAFTTQTAFAPMARVEDADVRHATLRVRAGGLITSEDNVARIVQGDVLQPFVRRDDRNGAPTLLQSIPWTYLAITKCDDINAQSYIYSGIRGALAGRKNKRTKKIGLKVRPLLDETDLKLNIIREANQIFPGAEVYRRVPGGEDLDLVARSDWRGITKLAETNLPEALYDLPKPTATEESKKQPATAAANDAKLTPVSDSSSKENGEKTENKPDEQTPSPATPPTDAKPPKEKVALNAPLYMYYIKNGNTLLAKLPIVTGLQAMEVAELPDDRRRLEAEAFVKGIQGEMLDLVARRQILASRIRQKLEARQRDEAQKILQELRSEKNYDKLSEDLDSIQRRILSSDRGAIPPGTQNKIDRMFDTTRQMLQRYLQDTLLRDLEVAANN